MTTLYSVGTSAEEIFWWSLPEELREEINRGVQHIAGTLFVGDPYRIMRIRWFIEAARASFGHSQLVYVTILLLEAVISEEGDFDD